MSSTAPVGGKGVRGGEETDDISDYKKFTFLDIHIHCIEPNIFIWRKGYAGGPPRVARVAG